jgi:hypothetical protein
LIAALGVGSVTGPVSSAAAQSPAEDDGNRISSNSAVAVVGDQLISTRDVMEEWRFSRTLDPSLPETPSEDQVRQLTKKIVENYLWIDHGKTFPRYPEVMTEKFIQDAARRLYGQVWSEDLAPGPRKILERRAEAEYAAYMVLQADPDIQRMSSIRPADVRQYYEDNPEKFVVKEQVLYAQVLIGKSRYGARAAEIAGEIRAEASLGRDLKEVCDELAPGAYREPQWVQPDEAALVPEILEFVENAQTFQISPVIEGANSYMLLELHDRTEARVIPFEDAAPDIERVLEQLTLMEQQMRYFVLKVLPDAYYFPIDLFQEEYELLGFIRPNR